MPRTRRLSYDGGMVGLAKILGCVIVTTLGLALFTHYEGGQSVTHVLGYPVVAVAQKSPTGLIAIGQVNARGIIVLGQMGFGLVTVAQGGVGLLFGVGQLMGGVVAIAQVGIGLFFFLGQLGFGASGIGQVAGINRGGSYFKEMSAEFGELLSLRRSSRARGGPPGGGRG